MVAYWPQSPNAVTTLFGALARVAASNVAIGSTSAGMAILGQASYVDLPGDSVNSRFATQRPLDSRVNIVYQGGKLPFVALSSGYNAPLYNFVTDTHFSSRDRMGRMVAFAAKSYKRGLGADEDLLRRNNLRQCHCAQKHVHHHKVLIHASSIRYSDGLHRCFCCRRTAKHG